MPYMMNGTLGGPYVNKQGEWLGAPDAVLYGMSAGGLYRAVLVNLNSPKYDPATTVLMPCPQPCSDSFLPASQINLE